MRYASWDSGQTTITVYTERDGPFEAEFYFVSTEKGMTYTIHERNGYGLGFREVAEDAFYERLRWYVPGQSAATLQARTAGWFADAAMLGAEGYVAMMMHMAVSL
jgi:hypothetical protein